MAFDYAAAQQAANQFVNDLAALAQANDTLVAKDQALALAQVEKDTASTNVTNADDVADTSFGTLVDIAASVGVTPKTPPA